MEGNRLRTGVLIVGHGTRNQDGQREFLEVVRNAERLLAPRPVVAAYLELVEPDIATGIDQLASQGIEECIVAPVLLFAAGHAKRDLPACLASARERHPRIRFRQAGHLGLHEDLLELSAHRFWHAQMALAKLKYLANHRLRNASLNAAYRDGESSPNVDFVTYRRYTKGRTLLILVGRGSLDEDALEETREFAARRRLLTPVEDVRTCFLAMAKPNLTETLAEAVRLGFENVVVQPHLLFAGDLLERAYAEVGRVASEASVSCWWLADHLGPNVAVARALADRVVDGRSA